MGVAAYWSARPASLGAAVEFLETLRRALASFGAPYDNLVSVPDSTRVARIRWSADPDDAERLVLAGRNFTDIGHEWLAHLGFTLMFVEPTIGVWKAGVELTVGATTEGYPNAVHVSLPTAVAHNSPTQERLVDILGLVIETCDPDWGTISSNGIRRLLAHRKAGRISVGWYTYLSSQEIARRPPLPSLPSSATTSSIDSGTLVQLKDQWLDSDDSIDQSIVREMEAAFHEAGWLTQA